MRIVTRPDFDGIVCAALLYEVLPITEPVEWVQPSDMQRGGVQVQRDDIIANLPYSEGCALWFDHHVSNQPKTAVQGSFITAPSAARVIFDYYRGRFKPDFEPLVIQTDHIDSADLTRDQIEHPENYPHVLLSMTIHGQSVTDRDYWNRLVSLLRKQSVEEVMADPEVQERCLQAEVENALFRQHLLNHTQIRGPIAITDFRSLNPVPDGNRYLVYSLFPETSVSLKLRCRESDPTQITVSVGRSILNKTCRVNVGLMLTRFGGGGHAGAGACTIPASQSARIVPEILEILLNNQEMEA